MLKRYPARFQQLPANFTRSSGYTQSQLQKLDPIDWLADLSYEYVSLNFFNPIKKNLICHVLIGGNYSTYTILSEDIKQISMLCDAPQLVII